MVRGELLIFGYRELFIDPERVSDAAGILLKLGIVGEISPCGRIIIPLRRCKDFVSAIGEDASVSFGRIGGIPGLLARLKHRSATVCALVILLAVYFVLGNVIWDIRIVGNTSVSENEILSELSEVGVRVGAFWSRLDRNEAETQLLSKSDALSWISINRSGGVACVEVAELVGGKDDAIEDDERIGNIVSDRDCVIEEITVNRGVAAVKVGDVVKEGDILISGVVETEKGTEYCHAGGSVIGVSDGEVCVFGSSVATERILISERTSFAGVKIFGFSLNILKKYGNSDDAYAIIEEKPLVILGKTVPISFLRVKQMYYDEREIRYETDKLVEMVSRDFSDALLEFLAESDMVGIRTSADFCDDGYKMTGRVIYSTDVGVFAPIEFKEDQ